MIQILKKIDFIKIAFLLVITAVFLMHSSLYYYNCFPNCYGWKEMMIKWTNGEIVRRGLLGTIFYSLEPYIRVKFSSTFLVYICLMICSVCIYNRLKKLKLPFWLLSSILLSPALFLFNLHYTLLYKKDLIVLAACICFMLFVGYYWSKVSNKPAKLRNNAIVFSLIYLYLYIFILLCYEVFIVFVPFVCLYIFFIVTKYNNLKYALKLSLFLLFISALLFSVLTFPYIGNQDIVVGIIRDWAEIYPNFKLVNVDPLPYLMIDKETFFNVYLYVFRMTKVYEMLLIYILMILPLIIVFKYNLVSICLPSEIKDLFSKHTFLCYLALFCVIHFPLSLSIVAFDYGRWFVYTFYLMVLFLCFFAKSNIINSKKIRQSRIMMFICIPLSVVYVATWQPQHWAPAAEGHLITMDEYRIFKKLYYFYSEPHNLSLILNEPKY